MGQRVRHVAALNSTSFAATTTYTYNADGQKTSETSPDGNLPGANAANYTTTYVYGPSGQLISQTQAGGVGATVTPRTTSYTYDTNGNRTSMTDPRGYTTTYSYNSNNQQTLVTDPMGHSTLTCYDGDGNVIETVPAVGVAANSLTAASCASAPTRLASDATTYTYNTMGQKVSMTTPAPAGLSGTETTTYTYDANGNLASVTAPPTSNAVGAPSDVTFYTYNNLNQLTATTTGYGTSAATTTSSCYDPNGDVTATVPGDGNTSGVVACSSSAPYQTTSPYQTGYSFDSLGQMVTQSAPATSAAPSGQVTNYTYDPAGNQLTMTNPNGVTTTKTYTPLGQVQTVNYSNNTNPLGYSYDANGHVMTMIDASGVTTNIYDPFGELTSTTNGSGQTTTFGYGADGLNTSIGYPLPTGASWASTTKVTMAYNYDDQLQSVTDFNGHTSTLTYTADGLPSSVTLGSSGDTVNTTYAASDNVASISLESGSSTLAQFTYSDAPSGAVASESDTPSGSFPSASYAYDAQGRVTGYTPTPGTASTYTQGVVQQIGDGAARQVYLGERRIRTVVEVGVGGVPEQLRHRRQRVPHVGLIRRSRRVHQGRRGPEPQSVVLHAQVLLGASYRVVVVGELVCSVVLRGARRSRNQGSDPVARGVVGVGGGCSAEGRRGELGGVVVGSARPRG